MEDRHRRRGGRQVTDIGIEMIAAAVVPQSSFLKLTRAVAVSWFFMIRYFTILKALMALTAATVHENLIFGRNEGRVDIHHASM
jgi:hypothetical protein